MRNASFSGWPGNYRCDFQLSTDFPGYQSCPGAFASRCCRTLLPSLLPSYTPSIQQSLPFTRLAGTEPGSTLSSQGIKQSSPEESAAVHVAEVTKSWISMWTPISSRLSPVGRTGHHRKGGTFHGKHQCMAQVHKKGERREVATRGTPGEALLTQHTHRSWKSVTRTQPLACSEGAWDVRMNPSIKEITLGPNFTENIVQCHTLKMQSLVWLCDKFDIYLWIYRLHWTQKQLYSKFCAQHFKLYSNHFFHRQEEKCKIYRIGFKYIEVILKIHHKT